MHDYILGFVCFMAGALFVVIVGLPLLEGQHEDDLQPQPEPREDVDAASVEPRR
jgi:hypothetical protein